MKYRMMLLLLLLTTVCVGGPEPIQEIFFFIKLSTPVEQVEQWATRTKTDFNDSRIISVSNLPVYIFDGDEWGLVIFTVSDLKGPPVKYNKDDDEPIIIKYTIGEKLVHRQKIIGKCITSKANYSFALTNLVPTNFIKKRNIGRGKWEMETH